MFLIHWDMLQSLQLSLEGELFRLVSAWPGQVAQNKWLLLEIHSRKLNQWDGACKKPIRNALSLHSYSPSVGSLLLWVGRLSKNCHVGSCGHQREINGSWGNLNCSSEKFCGYILQFSLEGVGNGVKARQHSLFFIYTGANWGVKQFNNLYWLDFAHWTLGDFTFCLCGWDWSSQKYPFQLFFFFKERSPLTHGDRRKSTQARFSCKPLLSPGTNPPSQLFCPWCFLPFWPHTTHVHSSAL